jgi:hypothetical protein
MHTGTRASVFARQAAPDIGLFSCPSGERIGALAQYREISPVTENPAPLAARHFLNDAEALKIGKGRIDRRRR